MTTCLSFTTGETFHRLKLLIFPQDYPRLSLILKIDIGEDLFPPTQFEIFVITIDTHSISQH